MRMAITGGIVLSEEDGDDSSSDNLSWGSKIKMDPIPFFPPVSNSSVSRQNNRQVQIIMEGGGGGKDNNASQSRAHHHHHQQQQQQQQHQHPQHLQHHQQQQQQYHQHRHQAQPQFAHQHDPQEQQLEIIYSPPRSTRRNYIVAAGPGPGGLPYITSNLNVHNTNTLHTPQHRQQSAQYNRHGPGSGSGTQKTPSLRQSQSPQFHPTVYTNDNSNNNNNFNNNNSISNRGGRRDSRAEGGAIKNVESRCSPAKKVRHQKHHQHLQQQQQQQQHHHHEQQPHEPTPPAAPLALPPLPPALPHYDSTETHTPFLLSPPRRQQQNQHSSGSSSKKQDNTKIATLNAKIEELEQYVEELEFSESVEIGNLQQQVKKLKYHHLMQKQKNWEELYKVKESAIQALLDEDNRLQKIEKIIVSIQSLTDQSSTEKDDEYDDDEEEQQQHKSNDDDKSSDCDTDDSDYASKIDVLNRKQTSLQTVIAQRANSVQKKLGELQSYIQEMDGSESLEIGELKNTIKKLQSNESARSSTLQNEINHLRRNLAQISAAGSKESDNYSSEIATGSSTTNTTTITTNTASKKSVPLNQHGSNTIHDHRGDEGESIAFVDIYTSRDTDDSLSRGDDKEKTDLRREVETLKDEIYELSSSEAVEIGGLKKTIEILRRNESNIIKEYEAKINNLKSTIKEQSPSRSLTYSGSTEDLRAENKRLRLALLEKCSFDSSELELIASSSTSSRGTVVSHNDSPRGEQRDRDYEKRQTDGRLQSSDEDDSEISIFRRRLADKDEIIKLLKTKLDKMKSEQQEMFNKQFSESSSNPDFPTIRRSPRKHTEKMKVQQPNDISFSQETRHHGSSNLSSGNANLTLKSARPPLGSLQLKNNSEQDLNQKLRKKVSELSKEVNKWRIKATILVEKKNKAKAMSKENAEMKKKVEELKERLKNVDGGYESPLSSPMPPICPTTRCVV